MPRVVARPRVTIDSRGAAVLLNVVLGICLLVFAALPASADTQLDPNSLYGGCFPPAGFAGKQNHVLEVGKSLQNVVGIDVIDCHEFDGPGGTFIVNCPPGSPFTYCLLNENDGLGNHVFLGVIERTPEARDPNGLYGGCTTGARSRHKSELIQEVGRSLQNVVDVDVIDCHAFDGPGGTRVVSCPAGIRYSYCLLNENDGAGNHVMLGVIEKHPEIINPTGLYGRCGLEGAGTRPKSDHVIAAGKSLAPVVAIEVIICGDPDGGPGTFLLDCPPGFAYTYCLMSHDDGVGNRVALGVVEKSDTLAPTTKAAVSSPPNAAGWNRTDVSVTLTATDEPGGSGVKQLTFSASGAQAIASTTVPGATATVPLITSEGLTTLTFFATDQAGNVEAAKTLAVKIDKTPPEAALRFGAAQQDLVVLGRDAGSGVSAAPLAPVSVVPMAPRREGDDGDDADDAADHDRQPGRAELRTYQVQDAAGNTLRLSLEVRQTAHQLRAEVASLQYNAAAVVRPAQNRARFAWRLDQAGQLQQLQQALRVGGERQRQAVTAEFRARDHQTRIEVAAPRPEHTLTKPGLVLLDLVTSAGALRVAF